MPKDANPPQAVTLVDSELSEMSKNETLKLESQGLFWVAGKTRHSFRSEIEDMTAGRAPTLSNEGKEISKHFGIYKQQERIEGRKSHNYIFMVRLRVPSGGEFSAQQWAAICDAADRFGDGSLRLTTRQGVQFHYVTPPALGPLIRFLNRTYPSTGYQISTLAACGDVNRNTMCCAVDDLLPEMPLRSRELAYAIAMELAPRSSAYYQVFLTDEAGKTETPLISDEPIYGPQYLPRKFKVAIAHPLDNSVDALTNDVAFVPVVNGALAEEYDLYAGGGLGTTHGMEHTKALLALYLGRVPRAQVVDATRAIAILQKEHGDRGDRRMARWKYTIRRLGVDAVKQALRERFQLELKDAAPQPLGPNRFFHGWYRQAGEGRWFLGIPVESGRVRDTETCRLRSAVGAITSELREIAVRITGNQDLILAHVPETARARRRDPGRARRADRGRGLALPPPGIRLPGAADLRPCDDPGRARDSRARGRGRVRGSRRRGRRGAHGGLPEPLLAAALGGDRHHRLRQERAHDRRRRLARGHAHRPRPVREDLLAADGAGAARAAARDPRREPRGAARRRVPAQGGSRATARARRRRGLARWPWSSSRSATGSRTSR